LTEEGQWRRRQIKGGRDAVMKELRLLKAAGYTGLLALEIDYLNPRLRGGGEEAADSASVEWLRASCRVS
jgi:hypothetical protein